MNARQASIFMRAFGDGTRLRILSVLSDRQLTVGELARLLQCPQPKISRHLRYLHARGLVEFQGKRNSVVYRLAQPRHELHGAVLAAVQESLATIGEVQRDRAKLRGRAKH